MHRKPQEITISTMNNFIIIHSLSIHISIPNEYSKIIQF